MPAKPFFKSLSWLLLLNLLIKPAWIFLIDRQVQNMVGQQAYGEYFALFSLTYVLLFVADAGLTTMLGQRLAAGEALPVRQLLLTKCLLLLAYALTCGGTALLTGVSNWPVLFYLVFIQSIGSLFLFLRSLLTARQQFRTDAYFSVLDKTLLLLFCAGPVYGLFAPITIPLFLQLQILSLSVATASLLLLLVYKKAITPGRQLTPRQIVAGAAPFMLLLLLMSAHNRLDAFLLERLHTNGAAQAGLYAMGYRLLDAANMLGYLTASFLVPFLARNRNQPPVMEKVVLLCRHGLLFVATILLAFAAFFSPWLQQLLYHHTTAAGSTVIVLCLAVLPAYYLVHIYGSVLTAMGLLQPFIKIVLACLVLNLALNFWLAPAYGAVGCGLAALVSQYGCGLVLWLVVSRRLPISAGAGTALLYLAAALIFALLFALASQITGNVWLILSSIALVVVVLLLATWHLIKKTFLPFYK